MKFLKNSLLEKKSLFSRIFFPKGPENEVHRLENFHSKHLKRPVKIDLFLPLSFFKQTTGQYPLLIFNDGQDMEAVQLKHTLKDRNKAKTSLNYVIVGIHAADRMHEYGTAGKPDYKKRGNKAEAYRKFLVEELIPFLQDRYKVSRAESAHAVAGFSLGGLSAFDLAWQHPEIFSSVGVFSGSLWWRSKAFKPNDPDADRIVHEMVLKDGQKKGLKFWLQAGTKDETSDRNNNGIIDAIDDTLDLIKVLKEVGYPDQDIKYVEVKDGEHNPATWGKVLPQFLDWLPRA